MAQSVSSLTASPSPDDAREALERIVASSYFRHAPQLNAILRYVIERELAGQGDRIKAYTIGVDVLKKPITFDPNTDPIIRVEARRLRLTLKYYYENEGQNDPMLVTMPLGSYRPEFTVRPKPEPTSLTQSPNPPVQVQRRPALSAVSPQVVRPMNADDNWVALAILIIALINCALSLAEIARHFGVFA